MALQKFNQKYQPNPVLAEFVSTHFPKFFKLDEVILEEDEPKRLTVNNVPCTFSKATGLHPIDDERTNILLGKSEEHEYVSGCCGASMNGHDIDYEMCPDCKEHCEIEDLAKEDEPSKCMYCQGTGESNILASRWEHDYKKCSYCKGSGLEPDVDSLIDMKDERH